MCVCCLLMMVWQLKDTDSSNMVQTGNAVKNMRLPFILLFAGNLSVVLNTFFESSRALYVWGSFSSPSFGPYMNLTNFGIIGMEFFTFYQLCMLAPSIFQ